MKKLLALLVMFTVLTTACSTAWVTTLDSIVAAAAPALINVLQIVAVAEGKPFDAVTSAKINADAAALTSFSNDFAKASASAAPDACAQLTAAVTVFGQDIATVESVAQVSNPQVQTKIALLLGLSAGTIRAITAVIPACQAPAPAALAAAPPLSLQNYVADYNAILKTKTGVASVDKLTPKLKLHQHGKVIRYASFGLLK